MSWLKIDDGFAENKRVAGVSDRALRLHLIALCYCARNLTDGVLDERDAKIVCAILDKPNPPKYIRELLAAELWVECGPDGYEIAGYLEYNPEAVTVKAERKKARIRMQDLRKKKASSEERSDERSDEHSGEHAGERSPSPSRPVPAFGKSKALVVKLDRKAREDEAKAALANLDGVPRFGAL